MKIEGGATAGLQEIVVAGCGGIGVDAASKAQLSLRRVVIQRDGLGAGLRLDGATAVLEQSVVRDSRSSARSTQEQDAGIARERTGAGAPRR